MHGQVYLTPKIEGVTNVNMPLSIRQFMFTDISSHAQLQVHIYILQSSYS